MLEQVLFQEPTDGFFIDVVLPFATPKPYTYHVADAWRNKVAFGCRVEVQFGTGRDVYTALVVAINVPQPEYKTKSILQVIDSDPIINQVQLRFWQWLAQYYMCTLGDVMNAALPANLKLSSETRIVINPEHNGDFSELDDKEYLVAEALTLQKELSLGDVQKILNQKAVYPIINRLLMWGVLELKELVQQKYKPKKALFATWGGVYKADTEGVALNAAFELVKRSEKQTTALLAFLQLSKNEAWVKASDICDKAAVDVSVLRGLEKKGILVIEDKEVSRLAAYDAEIDEKTALSAAQQVALTQIEMAFQNKDVVLLQGITGSGKTRLYMELLEKARTEGRQALYLLPEIALTEHIIARLKKFFGNDVMVYHSKMNSHERVELWQKVLAGQSLIVGARSALFLPFKKLDYIIVDEEHDPSFKQNDPNPRYNARDAAVFLAHLHTAKVLLGTATPSVESYFNAQIGKYGFVGLEERFGNAQLPDIQLIDNKKATKDKRMLGFFSLDLIEALKATIERGEQAILFQNRRGYAPTLQCTVCGWSSECKNCDVHLTYHKFAHTLNCHYCGFTSKLPKTCPACASNDLKIKGLGTERVEDELKIHLPEARISRMDLDTARSKMAHAHIIQQFETHQADILIGTQMVTKGLDFENVGLVGILSADNLLKFPDFRASERAFQLMAQVAGRAGRKNKKGLVLIQAYDTQNPILKYVVKNDYKGFFQKEIAERQQFIYPPFFKLISLTVKHKKPEVLQEAVKVLGLLLRQQLGDRVHGPAVPHVSRVNTYFLVNFLIKIERDSKVLQATKQIIAETIYQLQHTEGYSTVRVAVDVDPY